MFLRQPFSRRDAFLVLLGASSLHILSLILQQASRSSTSIIIGSSFEYDTRHGMHVDHLLKQDFGNDTPNASSRVIATVYVTETLTLIESPVATNFNFPESASAPDRFKSPAVKIPVPSTSIQAHAPGWTLFRNIYMANGTMYIVAPHETRPEFPQFRFVTSTGLIAINTPENIASREPTPANMAFLTPAEANSRWGGEYEEGRTWTVDGNTVIFNDPPQFLQHYYHFVAELFFGLQAFWHGAFSDPWIYASGNLDFGPGYKNSHYSSVHPSAPPLDRAIFAHADPSGWRDGPGFNSYFVHAAYPSLSVETSIDWDERVRVTSTSSPTSPHRAFHFPTLLFVDRSAANRGEMCHTVHRTASEAWDGMRKMGRLRGIHVGGWWAPVREALWRFAGAGHGNTHINLAAELYPLAGDDAGSNGLQLVEDVGPDKQKLLPMPERIVITYISRQGTPRRRLLKDDDIGLIAALKDLVRRRNTALEYTEGQKASGISWELQVLQAEDLSKDEQIKAAARTTIMLGVHGNGLTHLVFMPPTRLSTVIEIFFPGGFAHDYEWTSRALGMDYAAVWNDTHYTRPNLPNVDYPDGFQKNFIPVHGPAVAELIETRVDQA